MVSDASEVPAYGISDCISVPESSAAGRTKHGPSATAWERWLVRFSTAGGLRTFRSNVRGSSRPSTGARCGAGASASASCLRAAGSLRGPGAWEQYRVRILAGTLLMLLQSALIASLLHPTYPSRARVERTLREREERSSLDIADRQESEDALRRNQQRYTMATAAGAVGVWDWNFETNEIYVDPSSRPSWGSRTPRSPTASEDWGSRVHPEDARGGNRPGAGLHRRRDRCLRDGAPDAAQGRQLEVVPLARIGGERRRWHAAPPGRNQGGHHRAQARRRRGSRERSCAAGQQSTRSGIWPGRSSRRRTPSGRASHATCTTT